ncbi:zn-finger protein [Nitrososphaeria virus YSH_922147]|uniref:Zn-finger protein n=1 Tax=Nitrososphaeria virus YSH_922147 TaxID=3071323 RepID=A0A976YF60_9CAUD|nr:zn-finger protein [Yangshan Harbor Nitrososphaeria virus]UVF62456.1 zn-finger protein [Nitrososphaeria virus YSH_922147]
MSHICEKCNFESLDPMVEARFYPFIWYCSKCNYRHIVVRTLQIKPEYLH